MHSRQKNNEGLTEQPRTMLRRTRRSIVRDTVVFAMLGALMFTSKVLMEALPNVHLIGVMIVALTVVYRARALYPIYVFVMLTGLYGGFSLWWIPYLYVWTVLWGVTMLLPQGLPKKWATVMYMTVCALHGFLYGVLYAPAQALFFGLDWKGTIAWIAAGFPFDLINGVSNFAAGILVLPIASMIRLAEKHSGFV
jgi:hypothetical protein